MMEIQPILKSAEAEAILTVCLLAAFSDGAHSESERATIKRISETLPEVGTDHMALYQKALLGQVSSAQAAQSLGRQHLRQLAYEMAVCVCEADNLLTPKEKSFLQQLSQVLGLDAGAAERIENETEALAFATFPLLPATDTAGASRQADNTYGSEMKDVEKMILNYAILNGALELLPQSLATMAIIPLQMKMVYRIGKAYGYELDRRHIKELLVAAGVGLSSQVLESFATKLFGGLLGKIGGKLGKTVVNQATSSAMSFAATYAIGHMAQNYYAGGRMLSGDQMRRVFDKFKANASELHSRYAYEIQTKSQSISTVPILDLIRGQ